MSSFLLILGIGLYIIGFIQLFRKPGQSTASGISGMRPSGITPASVASNPARTQPVAPKEPAMQKPLNLSWIEIGSLLSINHPQGDFLRARVLGIVAYQELSKRSSGAQSEWAPTGNIYAGFLLEGNILLLNWQNRYYLLDQSEIVSDVIIKQHFLPYAQKFGQSGQSAAVTFAYPPAVWTIEDIGRFTVQSTTGQGFQQQRGAEGRFIHSSGEGQRALVVEDYRGGQGGQDTIWTGYQIEENAIKLAS